MDTTEVVVQVPSLSRLNLLKNHLADLWEFALDRNDNSRSDDLIEARRLFKSRKFSESRAILQNCEEADAESFNLRGLCSEQLGEFSRAFDEYCHAFRADRQYWAAEMNLRRCYELRNFGESRIPLLL